MLKYLFELMDISMFYLCGIANQDEDDTFSLGAESQIQFVRSRKGITKSLERNLPLGRSFLGAAVKVPL